MWANSCLPAHVLTARGPPLPLTLDACAAPGNKTTHLAALLHNHTHSAGGDTAKQRPPNARAAPAPLHKSGPGFKGRAGIAAGCRVIALDVDKKRCNLLQETVSIMGAADVVSVMNKDFLKIDPTKEPFCAVEGIMLDPSCSGSGAPPPHLGCARARAHTHTRCARDVTHTRTHWLLRMRKCGHADRYACVQTTTDL